MEDKEFSELSKDDTFILTFSMNNFFHKLNIKVEKTIYGIYIREILSTESRFDDLKYFETNTFAEILTDVEEQDIIVNIDKINYNNVKFNILKKDEKEVIDLIGEEIIILIENEEEIIKAIIKPQIDSIKKTEKTKIKSKIEFDNKEDQDKFIKLLDKRFESSLMKEKQSLLDNFIRQSIGV